MNKKKNQTSIDLDAIMTEVLNLFTPEEQQEVIDILSNNGLEKSTNKWKKLSITINIRTIARKQPPLQLTCKGFGICRHAKTTHLTSLKRLHDSTRCRIRKRFAQLYPASIYPLSRTSRKRKRRRQTF